MIEIIVNLIPIFVLLGKFEKNKKKISSIVHDMIYCILKYTIGF